MRTLTVTRYVTPLREGGSMPAIVEADDDGMYVLKFRGAGQGTKALIAEHVAGAIAEALGLPIPERVSAELDVELGRTEPDPEIQELIQASGGTNLALDYLPGSVNYDPVADADVVTPALASEIVWFDAFITNVDRTARNTNMLVWHDRLWLIDHGASLYFHHRWPVDFEGDPGPSDAPFELIREHVLLPQANEIEQADARLASKLSESLFRDALDSVPESWLSQSPGVQDPDLLRAAYVTYLSRRLAARAAFVGEAIRARAN